MEKRSPKCPAIVEPNQLGCMWSFSGIFHSHHGRPNQKLLSNESHGNKTLTGARYARSQVKMLTDFDEKCKGINIQPKRKTLTPDDSKRSVENVMEKEVYKMDAKKHRKARKDPRIVAQQHSSCPMPVEICLHNEGLCNQIFLRNGRHSSFGKTKHDQLDEIDPQLPQMSPETFIDQTFVDEKYLRKDYGSHQSRQFLDSLEIINSNKDLFLKLLQDPDSLLVKHIQSLQDVQAEKATTTPLPEAKSSERKCENPVHSMEVCKRTVEKSLWKRIKSRYEYPNKEKQNPRPSNTVVVLKPGQKTMQSPVDVRCHCSYLQSHHSLTNKEQITKSTHFSFRDIRRKLKNAKGDNQNEKHWISINGTSHKLPLEVSEVRSAANFSTATERGNKTDKPTGLKSTIRSGVGAIDESASEKLNLLTVAYSKQQDLDIFVEARRHLSERLRQVEKGEVSSNKQSPRAFERILFSSPEHDSLATLSLSPKWERNYGSVSTQMRASPYGNSQVVREKNSQTQKEKKNSSSSLLKQNEDIHPCSYDGKPNYPLQILDSMVEGHETACFMTDASSFSGYVDIMETDNILQSGDLNLSKMPSEQSSTDTTRIQEGNGCLEGLRSFQELPLGNEPLKFSSDVSSPNTVCTCKLEIMDSNQEREENPSPVSILEAFFVDNISSPTSTTTESAEPPMQPLHHDFDEQSQTVSPLNPKISSSTCMENKELLSAYVKTVYQASQLNWDEFLVEGCPTESCCDQKLLYDCIKEVLIDLHQCYFGCSPWISSMKSEILPVSLEETVVSKVLKEVEWYTLPRTMPRTLDQLVGKDVAKSGKWVYVGVGTEDIVIEIVEAALEESIMEVILDIHQ